MTRAKSLTCVRCGEHKPAEAFVNDRTRSSGKFPWCKPCVFITRKETKSRGPITALDQPLPGIPGRLCPGCETPIDGAHRNRRFCSDSCKDKVRRWSTFGLEPDEYRRLIASNKGRCPICQKQVRKWVLDHNHDTGETTGATCSICNQSLLAYSGHNTETARRLVAYLVNPPIRALLGGPRYVGPEALEQFERAAGWRKQKGYSVGLARHPQQPPIQLPDQPT